MTFPVVQSITQTQFGSDTTEHLVSMPATVNSGDLLIILFGNDQAGGPNTPSGWTQLFLKDSPSSEAQLSGYAKNAAGTEGGTTVDVVTDNSQRAAAQTYRITGWFGTLATGVTQGTATSGSSANPDSPSLNPSSWDVEDTLWITVFCQDTLATISSYPTSYTDGTRTISSSDDSGDCTLGSARRENATSAEDPGQFTTSLSTADWAANTIAIRPAAAAVTTIPIFMNQYKQRWR